jgi:hypothetical protein
VWSSRTNSSIDAFNCLARSWDAGVAMLPKSQLTDARKVMRGSFTHEKRLCRAIRKKVQIAADVIFTE